MGRSISGTPNSRKRSVEGVKGGSFLVLTKLVEARPFASVVDLDLQLPMLMVLVGV